MIGDVNIEGPEINIEDEFQNFDAEFYEDEEVEIVER